jgi:hypothetical protein
MGVENKTAALAQLGYYWRADCNIWDKVTVHHVEVYDMHTGRLNDGYLVSQPRKIGA